MKYYLFIIAFVLLMGLSANQGAQAADKSGNVYSVPTTLGAYDGMIAMSINPDPDVFPTMRCCLHTRISTFITINFPNVPGSRVDVLAYVPSHPELLFDFIDLSLPGDHQLRLRHRLSDIPHLNVITTFTATPGAIECEARLALDPEMPGKADDLPDKLRWPNLCWALKRAPNFGIEDGTILYGWSKEQYYDWIGRCFIYTEGGPTFLNDTRRRKMQGVPDDDIQNSPPLFGWTQHYAGVWQDATRPPFPPNTSLDRYEIPVIGAVSNDGKYLAAVASDWTQYAIQGGGMCLHHVPQWMPADAPLLERSWRVKMYVMENDPDLLLERAKKDFPDAEKRLEDRIPESE